MTFKQINPEEYTRNEASARAEELKKHAVGFAWWIFEKGYIRFTDGEFGSWQDPKSRKLYSTSELYTIFNPKV